MTSEFNSELSRHLPALFAHTKEDGQPYFMKIRGILGWMVMAALVAGCKPKSAPRGTRPPTVECLVKTTPVKDQGESPLCWAYAMLATIESEHLMKGDSVNLSPQYVGRMFLEEQAQRYYLTGGKEPISLRGMGSALLRLIQRYGLTHYDAYHPEANFRVMERKVEKIANMDIGRRLGTEGLRKHVADALDGGIRPLPKFVFMHGAEYTVQEFARSVCMEDEYLAFTSFTHHPFGERFVLESADNYYRDEFMNIPIDKMMHYIDQALRSGHPVCWEDDISEPLFSFPTGVAKMENEREKITQDMRQRAFEQLETTDDHCMELIGIAHTAKGRKYYVCKNSWGTNNPFGGLMYMSENYLRAKTLAVWMSREAIENDKSSYIGF